MRISESKVVQMIEKEPPKQSVLVLLDEITGAEVELWPDECDRLLDALMYFHPYIHGMFTK